MNCPCCGVEVEVVSGDEGTRYYRVVVLARLRDEIEYMIQQKRAGLWRGSAYAASYLLGLKDALAAVNSFMPDGDAA